MPAITDMAAVIDAMHTNNVQTVAMATPFRQFINDRLVKYLATENINVIHDKALGIERNTENSTATNSSRLQNIKRSWGA